MLTSELSGRDDAAKKAFLAFLRRYIAVAIPVLRVDDNLSAVDREKRANVLIDFLSQIADQQSFSESNLEEACRHAAHDQSAAQLIDYCIAAAWRSSQYQAE